MAAGDQYQKISPNDQWVMDVSGNVVGIRSPHANGNDLRFDPSSVAITGGAIAGIQVAPPQALQIVATRGQNGWGLWGGAGDGNLTTDETRLRVRIGPSAVHSLKVVAPNWYIGNNSTGESAAPNAATQYAALEKSDASLTLPGYVSGVGAANNATGPGGAVFFDVPGFEAAAGDDVFVRMSQAVSSGQQFINTGIGGASGDAGCQSTAGVTQINNTGAISFAVTGGRSATGIGPLALLGIPVTPHPAVILIGDSHVSGSNDAGDGNGNIGAFARGLYSVNGYPVPWMMNARGGQRLQYATMNAMPRQRLAWKYATHVLICLGTNDIANGRTLVQMQADAQTLWTSLKRIIGPYGKALKVYHNKVFPSTTSSDTFQTLANQTITAGFTVGGIRDQFNTWLDTQVGSGLLDGTVDLNPIIEDQTSKGKWVVTGAANYATSDGVHLSTALAALAKVPVTTWAATLRL